MEDTIVIEDEIAVRSIMTLIMDGALAARFLQMLKGHLEKPGDLFGNRCSFSPHPIVEKIHHYLKPNSNGHAA